MAWRRCVLLSVVGLVVCAPPAAAEEPLPAIAQYVESFPTSSGPVRGQASDPEGPKPRLSAPVENRLEQEGGSDETILRGLATEPSLGAPQKSVPHVRRSDEALAVKEALRSGSTPSARFFGAADLTDGGGNRLPVLLFGLLALTPLLLVGGRRRARQSLQSRRR